MFFPESEAITCFFCIVMKKWWIFLPFFCCLLSVDDVCVLFIVYVRICVAAVNLTLQDSLYCCLPEWVHNEKLQRNANISEQNDFFSNLFCSIFDSFKLESLLSEQGRRFSKEDEKFTLKKNFFCFQMLKNVMKFAFGPLVKTTCKLSGFLFACYTGTMLLWQIVSLQYISMFSRLLCHIWEKISKSVCIFNLICLKFIA